MSKFMVATIFLFVFSFPSVSRADNKVGLLRLQVAHWSGSRMTRLWSKIRSEQEIRERARQERARDRQQKHK
jgi:hypothetical protein